MLREFREFALKGNMIDLAVGLVLGAAFGTVINSLVKDVLMPPLGALLGGLDFSNMFFVIREGATPGPHSTAASAAEAGAVTLNYGLFANAVVGFIIVSLALFVVVRAVNKARKAEDAAPEAPPAPSAQETLLTEIRDILRAK
ncbi:MAG: large-conductance mechanosensitive channel protein MscL [Armatimonadetes bacterium]|nr:large-conductance mechanosensitive channel protein MscL [Armatimonadota bacterium]NOG93379.1 large-conductance mechanosensitive channel protein MscL [Armatimonadota bacterium]